MLKSRRNCVINLTAYNLDKPKKLANCKMHTKTCSAHPYINLSPNTVFCTKLSHRVFSESQFHCKLRVKSGPASHKSQCVDTLSHLLNASPVQK